MHESELTNSISSVAVVVPVFQHAQYLPRCVASVAWQLQSEDEIIIVEDEPREPFQFVGSCHGKVTWIGNSQRKGVSHSRNQAILETRTEWIKLLDADDVLAPFALDVIRNRRIGLSSEVKVVTGGIHRIINGEYGDYLNGAHRTLGTILNWNPILPSATFVRRDAVLEVGMFDERIDFEEDWDLWLKVHERFGKSAFLVVDQPIAYYWISDAEAREKHYRGLVEGLFVRDYFRIRYGAETY